MTIELVTTDGIFALDGGEWEVTNNIWLVGDDREVVVFDAAHDHHPIVEAVNGRRVAAIVLTHGHNDHINADDRMLWDVVWPGDSPDADLIPGGSINAGEHDLAVLHTPGHSPGCCCFHDARSGVVFTGDTLFCGGPGATGRSYSDEATILRGMRIGMRLLTSGRLHLEDLVSHRFRLPEINDAFLAAHQKPEGFVKSTIVMEI